MQALVGAALNALGILLGGALGWVLKSKISGPLEVRIFRMLGLFVVVIGVKTAWPLPNVMNIMLALVIGGILGHVWGLSERMDRWVGQGASRVGGRGWIGALVNASVIFNVGALAIVGSIQAGLSNHPVILESKAVLDGTTAMVLASVSGAGVLLAALVTFVYEGLLSIGAGDIRRMVSASLLGNVESVGGLIILAIGINFLGDETRIPVLDLLPALAVSAGLSMVGQVFGWKML
jgi:uncharacterized membrane protein YqgA involved in biofilm formation